ncbi:unnamed protein product [Nezara viridula]|uniref:Tetraspanin n=1 Tax=Nezara viridula TaxID=85310 RepID=A0A9P0HIX4_NEZVI|nr:unnamed protein product [Nezara viridula]
MVLGGPNPPPAMRYYRLWIYTCNALLFVSVIGFVTVACRVLISDPRRLLFPGLSLWQPSFLYAYLALIFQSGFLQIIGCLGASRLNERLLNIYWLLILVLLVGDVLLGVVWMYRFNGLTTELRSLLNHSILTRYGPDPEWTALWDSVQRQYSCCGVFGFQDFIHNLSSSDPGDYGSDGKLPDSCCGDRPEAVAAARRDFLSRVSSSTPATAPASVVPTPRPTQEAVRCFNGGIAFQERCELKILAWLTQTAHLLFVLGYCVIAFIKLCFLGILRYEIREMIQKIKLVQESSEKAEAEGGTKCAKQNNGTILQAPTQQNSIGREGCESPGRRPGKKHLTTVIAQDAGTDSDTNSHCALILCDGADTSGANGNNNYEMGELNRQRT